MNTDNKDNQSPFDEGFNKVAHDIPYSSELKAMSYTELSIALEHSKQGSARHSVLEREKNIRDNLLKINPVPDTAPNPSTDVETNSGKPIDKPNLLMSPIGYVWLTAIGGVLTIMIIFLINKHLGIPLSPMSA